MATRVTEYSRLARDFRLFGVEDRILDTLHGMIDGHRARFIAGRRSTAASRPPSTRPFRSASSSPSSSSAPGHASFAKNGFVLILVMRGLSYGAGVQGAIQSLRGSQGMLEDLMFDVRRFDAAQIVPPRAGARHLRGGLQLRGVLLRRGDACPPRHHDAHPGGKDRRHARTVGQRQDDHQPTAARPARALGGTGHDGRCGRGE